jgi:hypothetical protein
MIFDKYAIRDKYDSHIPCYPHPTGSERFILLTSDNAELWAKDLVSLLLLLLLVTHQDDSGLMWILMIISSVAPLGSVLTHPLFCSNTRPARSALPQQPRQPPSNPAC